ncbi:MAG: hypothetical protein EU548_08395, partial [Promethearchaeota archaeon]
MSKNDLPHSEKQKEDTLEIKIKIGNDLLSNLKEQSQMRGITVEHLMKEYLELSNSIMKHHNSLKSLNDNSLIILKKQFFKSIISEFRDDYLIERGKEMGQFINNLARVQGKVDDIPHKLELCELYGFFPKKVDDEGYILIDKSFGPRRFVESCTWYLITMGEQGEFDKEFTTRGIEDSNKIYRAYKNKILPVFRDSGYYAFEFARIHPDGTKMSTSEKSDPTSPSTNKESEKQVNKKTFEINQYLTLKLERGKTVIYVAGKRFRSCKYLLFNLTEEEAREYNTIESIDAAIERYSRVHEENHQLLDPETEFWGHCSNLQAWAENNYNTRLLDMRLAFPLLKRLTDAGDPMARKAFKDEIARRLQDESLKVSTYLIKQGYTDYLSEAELEAVGVDWVNHKGERILVIHNSLELEGRDIEDISEVEGLFELESLEKLNLARNNLTSLSESIGRLTSLKELNLRENKFTVLPNSLSKLSSLRHLNLSRNKLETLPKSIGKLTELEELNASDNNFKEFPRVITKLPLLKVLQIGHNSLSSLPKSFRNLTSLRELGLEYNKFTSLPESISELSSLRHLNIRGNYLETLPENIEKLTNLEELKASSNNFTEFPRAITKLTSLKILQIWGNKLT